MSLAWAIAALRGPFDDGDGPYWLPPVGADAVYPISTVQRGRRREAYLVVGDETQLEIAPSDHLLGVNDDPFFIPREEDPGSQGRWRAETGVTPTKDATLAFWIKETIIDGSNLDGSTTYPGLISSGIRGDTEGHVDFWLAGQRFFNLEVDPADPAYDQVIARYESQARRLIDRHSVFDKRVRAFLGWAWAKIGHRSLSEGEIIQRFANGDRRAQIEEPQTLYRDTFDVATRTNIQDHLATLTGGGTPGDGVGGWGWVKRPSALDQLGVDPTYYAMNTDTTWSVYYCSVDPGLLSLGDYDNYVAEQYSDGGTVTVQVEHLFFWRQPESVASDNVPDLLVGLSSRTRQDANVTNTGILQFHDDGVRVINTTWTALGLDGGAVEQQLIADGNTVEYRLLQNAVPATTYGPTATGVPNTDSDLTYGLGGRYNRGIMGNERGGFYIDTSVGAAPVLVTIPATIAEHLYPVPTIGAPVLLVATPLVFEHLFPTPVAGGGYTATLSTLSEHLYPVLEPGVGKRIEVPDTLLEHLYPTPSPATGAGAVLSTTQEHFHPVPIITTGGIRERVATTIAEHLYPTILLPEALRVTITATLAEHVYPAPSIPLGVMAKISPVPTEHLFPTLAVVTFQPLPVRGLTELAYDDLPVVFFPPESNVDWQQEVLIDNIVFQIIGEFSSLEGNNFGGPRCYVETTELDRHQITTASTFVYASQIFRIDAINHDGLGVSELILFEDL